MARMPSTRSQPLNPQVTGLASKAPVPTMVTPARRQVAPPVAVPEVDPDDERDAVARAGGFHESSYELRLGLDVSESEWPDDTTVPGRLGER